ncbi:MAG: hypothetical protein GY798_28955 [Hyphomicrobiales bacterium]|nr:hypothetical protein [Hyphomicrobiales bacterium]
MIALRYAEAFELLFDLADQSEPEALTVELGNWEHMGAEKIGPLLHSKVSLYLTDATEMLRGMAAMLSMGTGGACAPLARSVAERASRVNWLLEAELGDSRRRAARAALEHARGLEAYRVSLRRLGSPAAEDVTQALRAWRDSIEAWFPDDVQKPHIDPCDPDSELTKVASEWTVGDESLPDLHAEQAWVTDGFEGGNTRIAIGAYSALCGLTHANDLFLREHLSEGEGGRPVFEYTWTYMDKLLRFAVSSYGSALKHAAEYWGDGTEIVGTLDAIADDHDQLTVELAEAESEDDDQAE